jgi:hypothetical protein
MQEAKPRSEGEGEQMKRLSLNERRQIFLTQEARAREIRARLLAPPPRDPEIHDRPRLTWVIVTLFASILVGGGLALGNVVTFHVPLSVIDAVWPKL